MKFFYSLTLLIVVTLAPLSRAIEENTFEGFIYKSSGQIYFKNSADKRFFRVIPADRFVQQDLARLDSGDALMGSGYLEGEDNVLRISSVHFVGLSKMLGVWRSESNTLFEFVDFNTMTVYQQKSEGQPSIANTRTKYLPVKSYQYSVAPNALEMWSILINDETTINTGKLEVTNTTLEISLINPKTGETESTLTLKRAF